MRVLCGPVMAELLLPDFWIMKEYMKISQVRNPRENGQESQRIISFLIKKSGREL